LKTDEKSCCNCKKVLSLTDFSKSKSRKDGLNPECRLCVSARNNRKRAERTKSHQKWRLANKEHVNSAQHEYRKKDEVKSKRALYQSAYSKLNAEAINAQKRAWRLTVLDDQRLKRSVYVKTRESSDVMFKITRRLRSRFGKLLTGKVKNSSAVHDLGCSVEALRDHLEALFDHGMTWANYGQWHLDHVVPLASASTDIELKALCAFTNLQPLWANENLKKGAKVGK
jgi:hypothetical protein